MNRDISETAGNKNKIKPSVADGANQVRGQPQMETVTETVHVNMSVPVQYYISHYKHLVSGAQSITVCG